MNAMELTIAIKMRHVQTQLGHTIVHVIKMMEEKISLEMEQFVNASFYLLFEVVLPLILSAIF